MAPVRAGGRRWEESSREVIAVPRFRCSRSQELLVDKSRLLRLGGAWGRREECGEDMKEGVKNTAGGMRSNLVAIGWVQVMDGGEVVGCTVRRG